MDAEILVAFVAAHRDEPIDVLVQAVRRPLQLNMWEALVLIAQAERVLDAPTCP